MNEKYKIFKKGQTVVDLGYAPGSWSQVAIDRTLPGGRVIGIDMIPARPPRGVSTIQGNFLSPAVRESVKDFLRDPDRGRPRPQLVFSDEVTEDELEEMGRSYVEMERRTDVGTEGKAAGSSQGRRARDEAEGRMVDVVLSDMSAPWPQVTGYWRRSLSDPYYRMMNTSGLSFKDHAGSMDLCTAALRFTHDALRSGGHFICKFYQGTEDKLLETRLKKLFKSVHREKPESSRSESKEAYFVALRRRDGVERSDIFPDE
ncbi:MAG: 2' O-ribose methyltransferase [Geoglossum umbratile]|nr:MAG: 2' O-ribose methyltransferase [Geoglossum umbratile]